MSGRNVYVGGLSDRTRERDLEDLFKKYGRIEKVILKNRGYGFVEFEDSRDAEDAVKEMNGTNLDGSRIIVEIANGIKRRDSKRFVFSLFLSAFIIIYQRTSYSN